MISEQPEENTPPAALHSQGTRCPHSCGQHPVHMDPRMWGRLPEHLLGLVLAWLPLFHTSIPACLSRAWNATTKTPNFRRIRAEAHPRPLFGILGYRRRQKSWNVAAFDFTSHNWRYHEVNWKSVWGERQYWTFYRGGMYAHHGGLVCFIPKCGGRVDELALPILVGNPLTDDWKEHPNPVPNFGDARMRKPVLVELRLARDGCYKVMLVWRVVETTDLVNEEFYCSMYDSSTKRWSVMHSGVVHGDGSSLDGYTSEQCWKSPRAFDCSSSELVELFTCLDARYPVQIESVAMVEDHAFVLRLSDCVHRGRRRYEVAELEDAGTLCSTSDATSDTSDTLSDASDAISGASGSGGLGKDGGNVHPGGGDLHGLQGVCSRMWRWNHYRSPLQDGLPGDCGHFAATIFACQGFFLVLLCNGLVEDYNHQILRLYDMSARRWHRIPRMSDNFITVRVQLPLMLELWDTSP